MAGKIFNWAEQAFDQKRFKGDRMIGNKAWSSGIERILYGEPREWSFRENPVQSFRVETDEAYAGHSHHSPMVFISHRQTDADEAEKLAKLIVTKRPEYDVWLDVWDPSLGSIGRSALSDQKKSLLIALTIEMGLLNSTCLVALITDSTAGSAWIPYEYGRLKPKTPFAVEVAARVSQGVAVAEYLHLGVQVKDNSEVIKWLP